MMKKFFTASSLLALLLTGCSDNSQAREAKFLNTINISVNGKNFSATLEDNLTARAFARKLPLEVESTELNGNEKYFYLDEDLPSDSVHVGQIHAGDLMLFGANCVVIFYKDFATSYSYTRLGKIDNPTDLEKTLGNNNIYVTLPTSGASDFQLNIFGSTLTVARSDEHLLPQTFNLSSWLVPPLLLL